MSGVPRPPPYVGSTSTYGSSTSMRPCSGIRVAGIPSFCTKRCVFSETLEKYTRLQDGTAISSCVLLRRCRLCAQHGTGEPLDPVGTEARPVLVTGNHDGSLQISQRHHVVAGLGVQADVHLVVGDALLVQRLVRGVALHTCRLGVNGDAHRATPLSTVGLGREMGRDWQLLRFCMCTAIQQTAAPQNSHLADPLQPACDAG